MKRSLCVQDLVKLKEISDIQISDDGTLLAYSTVEISSGEDAYWKNIVLISANTGKIISTDFHANSSFLPVISPNNLHVSFLSTQGNSSPQLFIKSLKSGKIQKYPSLPSGVSAMAWSPCSEKIVFSALILEDNILKASLKKKRCERLETHNLNSPRTKNQKLLSNIFIFDLKSKSLKNITLGNYSDAHGAWSPDGLHIAFVRTHNYEDSNSTSAICLVHSSGNISRIFNTGCWNISLPSWSPDGTKISFFGYSEPDQVWDNTRAGLWVMEVETGRLKLITADGKTLPILPATLTLYDQPIWTSDCQHIIYRCAKRGNVEIGMVSIANGKYNCLVGGDRQVTRLSLAIKANRLAFCATNLSDPCNIFVRSIGCNDEAQVTKINNKFLSTIHLPNIIKRVFPNPNGGQLDAWIISHPGDDNKKAPLLLSMHGGPMGFVGNSFSLSHFYRYVLASYGWAIVVANPSGSGSYGADYADRIRGLWGELDLDEYMSIVDIMVQEGSIDSDNMFVSGYSYGGYLVACLLAKTTKFQAGIVGGGITNLEQFYLKSDIGVPFLKWYMHGNLSECKSLYSEKSPVHRAHEITTPLLIFHGKNDLRCPVEQAEELHANISKNGLGSSEFIRYSDSDHAFPGSGAPRYRLDFNNRCVDWLISKQNNN